jgi:hypothetical protein
MSKFKEISENGQKFKVKLMTINELTAATGCKRVDVNGFVAVLVHMGLITESNETAKVEGARGKPSALYSFPEAVELVFWQSNESENTENTPEVTSETAPETAVVESTVTIS